MDHTDTDTIRAAHSNDTVDKHCVPTHHTTLTTTSHISTPHTEQSLCHYPKPLNYFSACTASRSSAPSLSTVLSTLSVAMVAGKCLCGGVKMELSAGATKAADAVCHCTKCSQWGQHSHSLLPVCPAVPDPCPLPTLTSHCLLSPTVCAFCVSGMGPASMAEYKYDADGTPPVKVTAGKELVKEWTEKGVVHRAFCSTCGTHLYCLIPPLSVVTTGPGLWEGGLDFKPSLHTHYQHCMHITNDGLPKFKDMPAAFGGTGEMIADK